MKLFEQTPERSVEATESLSRLKAYISDLGLSLMIEQYGNIEFPVHKAFIFDKAHNQKWIGGGKGYKKQGVISAIGECFQHYLSFNTIKSYLPQDLCLLSSQELLEPPVLARFPKYAALFKSAKSEPFLTLNFQNIINEHDTLHYPLSLIEVHYNKLNTPKESSARLAWRAHDTGSSLGLSYHEALLHGINEWIEKYAFSQFISNVFFLKKTDQFFKLNKESLPPHILELIRTIETTHNDRLSIVFLKNEFDIPCFLTRFEHQVGYLVQPRGFSCSLNKQYAVEKSIFEALQCQLLRNKNTVQREKDISEALTKYPLFLEAYLFDLSKHNHKTIDYHEIPHHTCTDVEKQVQLISQKLQHSGYQIYQHTYRREACGLHTLHVLIPGLNENFLIKEGKFVYEHSLSS